MKDLHGPQTQVVEGAYAIKVSMSCADGRLWLLYLRRNARTTGVYVSRVRWRQNAPIICDASLGHSCQPALPRAAEQHEVLVKVEGWINLSKTRNSSPSSSSDILTPQTLLVYFGSLDIRRYIIAKFSLVWTGFYLDSY
jgi:hypothetical protein